MPKLSTDDVLSVFYVAKASPEEFFASVTKSSAEDVLSVSSVPKDSLGDVSVSSVPGASPMIIARKASPEQFSASVPMSSAEPSPGHVSLPSEESSPGLVFIDSVPYIVSESGPYWPPHTVSEPDPWPPSLILS